MKTSILIVMSAFLLSATVPVYALTNQELACQLAQVGCPVGAKGLEPMTATRTTVNIEMKSRDQFICELAQVNCPTEVKSFEPRITEFKSEMKNREQFVCELAQVGCPTEPKSL